MQEQEVLGGQTGNAPIDSEIIRTFAAALAAINRVTVDVKVGPGGSSM